MNQETESQKLNAEEKIRKEKADVQATLDGYLNASNRFCVEEDISQRPTLLTLDGYQVTDAHTSLIYINVLHTDTNNYEHHAIY